MGTLEKIAELARTWREAREAFFQHYKTEPKPFDYDNEAHMRWKWRSDRLCAASVKAEVPYREACDTFFAKACPDLIQLLVDVDDYFDGMVDADDGVPNFAMRCVTQIEDFLGPRPVAKPPRDLPLVTVDGLEG